MQATQPPTSEVVIVLKALPRAEDPPPPQSVNELMDCTLNVKRIKRAYGPFHYKPFPTVGVKSCAYLNASRRAPLGI